MSKVKEFIHEGGIRRLSLQTEEGKTLIEVPLALGVAGAWPARSGACVGSHRRCCRLGCQAADRGRARRVALASTLSVPKRGPRTRPTFCFLL